jgi:hypothetical protein
MLMGCTLAHAAASMQDAQAPLNSPYCKQARVGPGGVAVEEVGDTYHPFVHSTHAKRAWHQPKISTEKRQEYACQGQSVRPKAVVRHHSITCSPFGCPTTMSTAGQARSSALPKARTSNCSGRSSILDTFQEPLGSLASAAARARLSSTTCRPSPASLQEDVQGFVSCTYAMHQSHATALAAPGPAPGCPAPDAA